MCINTTNSTTNNNSNGNNKVYVCIIHKQIELTSTIALEL